MKTCDTCRFAAAPRYPDTQYRSCVRILHGNGGDHDHLELHPDREQRAIVVDGSGYAARLLVLPTFGCVLHEDGAPVRAYLGQRGWDDDYSEDIEETPQRSNSEDP